MGFSFLFWNYLGGSFFGEGDHIGLEQKFCGQRQRKAQRSAPQCMFWIVQCKRNHRYFEDAKQTVQALKNSLCPFSFSQESPLKQDFLDVQMHRLFGFLFIGGCWFFLFFFLPLGTLCTSCVPTFHTLFKHFLINLFFPIKKI